MATPALAKTIRAAKVPDWVKEKTINSLSPVDTGNAASALPNAVSPTLTPEPNVGSKSTKTPVGVKVLLAADALHNSARTVPVESEDINESVTLMNADMDVTVPGRGTTNAKSGMPVSKVSVPALRIVSVELPNPRIAAILKPKSPIPPSTTSPVPVLSLKPDAYGMIEPDPRGPEGPGVTGPCTVTDCPVVQSHLNFVVLLPLHFSSQCFDICFTFHLF
jgi:hypothetical protein